MPSSAAGSRSAGQWPRQVRSRSPSPHRCSPARSRRRGSSSPATVTSICVRITEPDRDSAELTAALKAKGLNITLETGPVSPSLVGSHHGDGVLRGHSGDRRIEPVAMPCRDGCEVGLRVPADFEGEAMDRDRPRSEAWGGVRLGRESRRPRRAVRLRRSPRTARSRRRGQASRGRSRDHLSRGTRGHPGARRVRAACYVEDVLPLSATAAFVFARPIRRQPSGSCRTGADPSDARRSAVLLGRADQDLVDRHMARPRDDVGDRVCHVGGLQRLDAGEALPLPLEHLRA